MLREQLNDAYKQAMRAKEMQAISTLRLILAALKDRDIAARGKEEGQPVNDAEILIMLEQMVRQRKDSIALYEQGGRLDLAEQEGQEIAIIERFMPEKLSDDEMDQAISDVIAEIEASCIKDMGRTMSALKEKYAGKMDFSKASAAVKAKLCAN